MKQDKTSTSHATLWHRLELDFLNNRNVLTPVRLTLPEEDSAQEFSPKQ